MQKTVKKLFCLYFLLFAIFVLSGCWDQRDIEINAFILGIGIDAAEDEKIEVTFEVALPQSFTGGGEGGNSGSDEATLDVSIIAEDMIDATNSLLGKLDLYPEFTHLQLVVLGEEYAKKGVQEVMDFFFRNPRVRYRTNVAVSMGEAKKVFEFKPKTSKSVSIYINKIIRYNSAENLKIFQLQTIGTIYDNFIRNSPIFLTKISPAEETIDVTGGGVFKDYKLIGWLSGEETQAVRWLQGDVAKGGVLRIEMPENKGGNIGFNIFNSSASLTPILENDQITADVKISIEGDIISIGSHDVEAKVDDLALEWEKALEEYIKGNVHNTFIKSRDVLGADIFEIDGRMVDYYPKYWEANKEQWDEIFETVELKLDVDVKIRRVGNAQP